MTVKKTVSLKKYTTSEEHNKKRQDDDNRRRSIVERVLEWRLCAKELAAAKEEVAKSTKALRAAVQNIGVVAVPKDALIGEQFCIEVDSVLYTVTKLHGKDKFTFKQREV